jgi:exodeoxyribonuclease VIII
MALSPAHYLSACQDGFEETISMKLGSGTHAMLLGKPWCVFTGKVRNGKVWDAFAEEHADEFILNQREADEAQRMRDSVLRCEDARALLEGLEFEVEMHWTHELQGRACRSTVDGINLSRVVELKSTRTAHPERFKRDAFFRYYHAQLAWYQDAAASCNANALLGFGAPKEAFIIAVENKAPYAVSCFELTPRLLEQGRAQCRGWLERVIQCERANVWPAYCDSIVPFDGIDSEPLALQIDGEDVEL